MKKTVLYIAAVLAVSGGLMWQKPMVAHAEPEVQKLFEKSALVIIDVNDAIANGYVHLKRQRKKIPTKTMDRLRRSRRQRSWKKSWQQQRQRQPRQRKQQPMPARIS